MAVGAAPVLVVTFAYKALAGTVAESMLPRSSADALARMIDGGRYVQIAASFARSLWDLGSPWTHPVLLTVALAFALGVATRDQAQDRLWLAMPLAGLLGRGLLHLPCE